jgi:two-component system response regulator MprA
MSTGAASGTGNTAALAVDGAQRALILVVERDPHIRAIERYFLEQAGYVVEFCDDGQDGLCRARALHPVIVITEILVPVLDGLSVCRALKSDPLTRDIPVLILSILSAEDRAQAAGADFFVKKPINDRRLVEAVERLLSMYRRPLPERDDPA